MEVKIHLARTALLFARIHSTVTLQGINVDFF